MPYFKRLLNLYQFILKIAWAEFSEPVPQGLKIRFLSINYFPIYTLDKNTRFFYFGHKTL